MKKTALIITAIFTITFAKAQEATFCEAVTKILAFGNKDKLVALKGVPVDREIRSAEKAYKSTLILPGFNDCEIRERYHAGCWFAAHIIYNSETDMMNMYNATVKQIQDCLTTTKQKFKETDYGPKYGPWWQCQKVKISLEHYVSGKLYVVRISFDPPF